DVVVATGGGAMVKAAYSSGKPAYGVGPGNVQCIIDKDSTYEEAVPKIITGRCFDNGIICSGEQSVIAPAEDLDAILELFRQNGAWI
ncbi:succinate-semialdehyde dehydrogenase, partial [Anoxynatronum sibiricum]